jgi:aspartyl-tRNA(Asn)/glutamyl-tRNA(Gln) amidotransferase subunit C
MPLSSDEVRHIATLARLGLSDAEVVSLAEELDVILEHVSRLATIDVAGVPETARIGGLVNAWRDDASRPSLPA